MMLRTNQCDVSLEVGPTQLLHALSFRSEYPVELIQFSCRNFSVTRPWNWDYCRYHWRNWLITFFCGAIALLGPREPRY